MGCADAGTSNLCPPWCLPDEVFCERHYALPRGAHQHGVLKADLEPISTYKLRDFSYCGDNASESQRVVAAALPAGLTRSRVGRARRHNATVRGGGLTRQIREARTPEGFGGQREQRHIAFVRRFVPLAVAGILVVVLAACTGRGGGYLPPQPGFTGQGSFGFTFRCEDGDLHIELSYNDKGSNPLGSSFGIHGTADTIDPVTESAICIGENPPPPPENQLIFLGRYRLTSEAPAGFPSACPKQETSTSPLCRFEVIVQDNDRSLAPSPGDFFSIKLSTATVCVSVFTCSQLPSASVFYARAGYLAGGNLTVD
jgi:hypothetical protein